MNKDSFCLYSKVRTSYIVLRLQHTRGIVTYFYQLCASIVILIAFFSTPILSLPNFHSILFRGTMYVEGFFFHFCQLVSMRSLCSIYNEAQHNTENTIE